MTQKPKLSRNYGALLKRLHARRHGLEENKGHGTVCKVVNGLIESSQTEEYYNTDSWENAVRKQYPGVKIVRQGRILVAQTPDDRFVGEFELPIQIQPKGYIVKQTKSVAEAINEAAGKLAASVKDLKVRDDSEREPGKKTNKSNINRQTTQEADSSLVQLVYELMSLGSRSQKAKAVTVLNRWLAQNPVGSSSKLSDWSMEERDPGFYEIGFFT
jgi:hypothetical protein